MNIHLGGTSTIEAPFGDKPVRAEMPKANNTSMPTWAVTMVSEPRCRAGEPAKLGPERGEGWRDPTSRVEENKPCLISRGGNLNHRGEQKAPRWLRFPPRLIRRGLFSSALDVGSLHPSPLSGPSFAGTPARQGGFDTIVTAHARMEVLSALGISALTGLSPKGASMVEVPPTAYKAWLESEGLSVD